MAGRVAFHAVLAYLLGSIPFAYIVGHLAKGVDIRRIGNGNVGARNTARHISPLAGVCVALLDIAKGSVAALLAQAAGLPRWWVLFIGLIAVLGHDFMFFLGFQGGQGMATTVGVLVVLLPMPTAVGVAIGLSMWRLLHINWDLSAAVGLGAIPLLAWIARLPLELVLYPVVLLLIVGAMKLVHMYTKHNALLDSTRQGETASQESSPQK